MKLLGPGGQFACAGGVLLPRDGWIVVGDLPHGNAVLNGANQRAEIAPNAGLFDDLDHWTTFPVSRVPCPISFEPPNSLMGTVLTRRPTQFALDAFILVDVSQEMIVQIEIFPLRDARQRAAADVGERAVAALVHPIRQAVNQVFDDAEAVVHDRGTDLQRPRAQRDEFGRVAPGCDAADPGNRYGDLGIARNGGDEMQRDWLDCRPAIAAMARLPGDGWLRLECREIDADNRVDRVDQ